MLTKVKNGSLRGQNRSQNMMEENVLLDNLIIECYTYRANMTPENFGLLFKSLVIAISGIIALGLAVLTLSGKVQYEFLFSIAIVNCHISPEILVRVTIMCSLWTFIFFLTNELSFIKVNTVLDSYSLDPDPHSPEFGSWFDDQKFKMIQVTKHLLNC
jgi:hypothetical protein